jgi:hypothetical protein
VDKGQWTVDSVQFSVSYAQFSLVSGQFSVTRRRAISAPANRLALELFTVNCFSDPSLTFIKPLQLPYSILTAANFFW